MNNRVGKPNESTTDHMPTMYLVGRSEVQCSATTAAKRGDSRPSWRAFSDGLAEANSILVGIVDKFNFLDCFVRR